MSEDDFRAWIARLDLIADAIDKAPRPFCEACPMRTEEGHKAGVCETAVCRIATVEPHTTAWALLAPLIQDLKSRRKYEREFASVAYMLDLKGAEVRDLFAAHDIHGVLVPVETPTIVRKLRQLIERKKEERKRGYGR